MLSDLAQSLLNFPAMDRLVRSALNVSENVVDYPNIALYFIYFWHHWSVYLAAAQIFTTGAVPFNDFPIQYGLGPMTLMAAGCLGECWSGAYAVVALSNVALLLSMMITAVLLLRNTSQGPAAGAAIALLTTKETQRKPGLVFIAKKRPEDVT